MFKSILLCVFTLLFFSLTSRARQEYRISEDLKYSWKSWDENRQEWVPYSWDEEIKSISFEVNLLQHAGEYLRLELPKGSSFFLNGGLVLVSKKKLVTTVSLDSLSETYSTARIHCRIFNNNWDPNKVETLLVEHSEHFISKLGNDLLKQTRLVPSHDLMIVSTVFVFFILVLFRVFVHRVYMEYFNISRAFSLRQKFELIDSHSPISVISISFMLLYAIFVGGTILNLSLKFGLDDSQVLVHSALSRMTPLSLSVSAVGLFFISILLKFPFIKLVAGVFNIQRFSETHFFSYVRLSLIISFLIYTLSVVIFLCSLEVAFVALKMIPISLIFIFFIRAIMLFLIGNKLISSGKMYLITYICTLEIVPMVFFLKILLR